MYSPGLCHTCSKPVYLLEKIYCIDNVYHKTCFRCTTCNIVLNLHTFLSDGGLPYCKPHLPRMRHTELSDTPEMILASKNTQLVSKARYQADLETCIRGKGLTIVDGLELLRIKKANEVISDVNYTGTLRRKKKMDEQRKSSGLVTRPRDSFYGTTTLLYSPIHGRTVPLVNGSEGTSVGSIADYDPFRHDDDDEKPIYTKTSYISGSNNWQNLVYHSNGSHRNRRAVGNGSYHSSSGDDEYSTERPASLPTGKAYRAFYDYEAADEDEVDFRIGDILIGCTASSENWLTCTVQRTGKRGLAPANFLLPM